MNGLEKEWEQEMEWRGRTGRRGSVQREECQRSARHLMAAVVFCNYMESVTRQPRLRLKYWSVIFEVIFSGVGEV